MPAPAAPGLPGGLPRRSRALACAIGGFGLGVAAQLNFLVPLRARELGAGYELIGLLVAVGALAALLVSVPLGALVDRWGARRSFVAGCATCALVALAFALTAAPWLLLVLQFAFGAARTLAWVASQAYVTAVAQGRGRAALTGRFVFVSNLATIAGPLLVGGAAQVVGFGPAFLAVAAYALAFAVAGTRLAPAAAAAAPRAGIGFGPALGLLRLPGMQVVLLLTFVRLWVEIVWLGFLPVHLVETGLAPATVSTVASVNPFVATLLAPTVGLWSRWLQRQAVAAIGLGCGALGLVVAPHLVTLPAAYASAVLVGVGAGVSLPVFMDLIGDLAPAHERGVALGLRQTANNLGGLAAPLAVGPLVTALGVAPAFAVGGGLAALALVGAWVRHVRAPSARPG